MSADAPGTRHTPAQRRALTVITGVAVAALAAGTFTVTYDALRALAEAGRVGPRWAPAYPVMADVLLVVVVLALLVARHAHWWSRALRWALLVALLAGGAALSVQHAVWGFGSLPQDRVRAGVAVAPHVMLVLAVWLWLTMIKHLRAPRPGSRVRPVPVEGAHVKLVERAPEPEPEPEEVVDREAAITQEIPPSTLPTDVELVRHGHAPEDDPDHDEHASSTTQPDLKVPTLVDDDDEDGPAVDRAEDPDAGDAEQDGRGRHRLRRRDNGAEAAAPEDDGSGDLPIWDWNPPSSSMRSSPTPPAE